MVKTTIFDKSDKPIAAGLVYEQPYLPSRFMKPISARTRFTAPCVRPKRIRDILNTNVLPVHTESVGAVHMCVRYLDPFGLLSNKLPGPTRGTEISPYEATL